jgi:hypothetical protein
MARYLFTEDANVLAFIDAKNIKEALEVLDAPVDSRLQIYRIASGPIEVRVASRTITTYDFGKEDVDDTGDSKHEEE